MAKHKRYRLLLDEDLPPKDRFKILNSRHDVKHIDHDLKRGGIKDLLLYKLAVKESRLIVTQNIKDFENMVRNSTKTGIIGLSPHLTLNDYIDTRVNALLAKKNRSELFGCYNFIPQQNERIR